MPIQYTVNTKIRYNGQEYKSVEDMPAEARQAFEKAIGSAQQPGSQTLVKSGAKISFNGHEYQTIDEMPAEVRQTYQKVLDLVDANHNGIPDSLEKSASPVSAEDWTPTPADTLTPAAPLFQEPTPAPKNERRRMLTSIAVFVLALVILGVLLAISQGGLPFK